MLQYSQKEVAEAIGVSTQSYATYERGRNEAPAEVLIRLAMNNIAHRI